MLKTTFRMLARGQKFECNGNVYTKSSSRTAIMESNGRTFYIGLMEHCKEIYQF